MAGKELVRSFDVDDTLVDRGPLLRAWGLVAQKAKHSRGQTIPPDSMQRMYHGLVSTPIKSPLEHLALQAHARRKPMKYVQAAVYEFGKEGGINVVNTGRSNKQRWVEMTRDQLDRYDIGPYFSRYYFKPTGVSSTESKLDVIKLLLEDGEAVEHYDDDPRTAIAIAHLFPEVSVNLVHHGLTGRMIPMQQLAQYPNLQVVTCIGDGLHQK